MAYFLFVFHSELEQFCGECSAQVGVVSGRGRELSVGDTPTCLSSAGISAAGGISLGAELTAPLSALTLNQPRTTLTPASSKLMSRSFLKLAEWRKTVDVMSEETIAQTLQ